METIRGVDIGLPLVGHIGTVDSHTARRIQTWHAHAGYELLFITTGGNSWEFKGGRTVEVTGGHFLVVPPGAVHRGTRAVRRPSRICGLLFDPDGREGWQNSTFTREDLVWLSAHFAQAGASVFSVGPELASRVSRLTAAKRAFELDPGNPAVQAGLRTLACSVILEATESLLAPTPPGPEAVIAAAKEYLGNHLREPVPISALVQRIGFSRSYLFAIFKSVTGMTPNDYYLRLRIEQAQRLLAGSSLPVTTIALETGFSSSQYFSSVFRKYTALTPLEYRRLGSHARAGDLSLN